MDSQTYIPGVIGYYPIIQTIATVFGSLGILSCGMHYGWSSPSLPKLLNNNSTYKISKEEVLWIPVAMPCGGIFGTILVAYMLNNMGRKMVLLLAAIPLTVSWAIISQVTSLSMLLVARFLAGISGAIVTTSLPVYVAEISEPKSRGFFLSGVTFIWIIGVLLMNIMGSFVTIATAAYISLTVPLLFFVSFLWMPESPYYLIVKGKIAQARASLVKLKPDEVVDLELTRLCAAIKSQKDTKENVCTLLANRANQRSLIIMMGTRGAQQFCGITSLMFYAQVVFKEAGNDISPAIASTIYFASLLITSGLSTAIVDRTGRKPLLVVSMASTGIALLIEACYFYIKNNTSIDTTGYSLVPIIGLIVYITAFSIGMQTVPVLIIGEIFPTSIRPIGVSFSTVYYYTCGAIVIQLFQFTMVSYGLHVPFFIFFGCSMLGLLFIILYVPETTGLTLEEIENKLNSS